jgi:Fe2+ transport system protein FeoA
MPIYTVSHLRLNLNFWWNGFAVIASLLAVQVPLDAMRDGESGYVSELSGPPAVVNRLQELGLRVGERVRMLRSGPPHLLQLGETRLCFRSEPEVSVLVGIAEG